MAATSTTITALPPMDKIAMIGISIETLLYGANCIMYGLSMLILLREGRAPTLQWVLLVTSTVLFLLCTVHIGASLQQLLDAFVYAAADVPDYSTIYWLDYTATLRVLKDGLFGTLVFAQDFVLIWRLYVVFLYNWRVIVLPIVLEVAAIGTAYAITAISALQNVGLYSSVEPGLIVSAWVLDITLNVSVTAAIAGRLWWMGSRMNFLVSIRCNRYASSIYVVVESGAIFAGAHITALALYASNSPTWLFGIDVASQLAVLTPLLIIVQIGLTGRYGIQGCDSSITTQDEFTFRDQDHQE